VVRKNEYQSNGRHRHYAAANPRLIGIPHRRTSAKGEDEREEDCDLSFATNSHVA
jgi:hypothetical protein